MALPAAMVLSGLPREQFTADTHYIFNHGAVLLKSPRRSSMDAASSLDSGVSSIESEPRSLEYYLDLISDLEDRFLNAQRNNVFKSPASDEKVKIMYENRNILNLAENLQPKWLFQHAVLQHGVVNFCGTLSQSSSTDEANPPGSCHVLVGCTDLDCSFREICIFSN